jgi:hypothetical protein
MLDDLTTVTAYDSIQFTCKLYKLSYVIPVWQYSKFLLISEIKVKKQYSENSNIKHSLNIQD